MVRTKYSGFWRIAAAGTLFALLLAGFAMRAAEEPTVEELKARVANAHVADRPLLCIRISERQLDAADKFYAAGDSDKAQAALADVTAFSELAADYAVQTHKHEKQVEIAMRKMVRKLSDLKHAVSREDQEQIQRTIDRLQRIRDNLLGAMFQKGSKQ